MANITESEIAGFGVGALLLIAALAAPKVDSFIARSQRRRNDWSSECSDEVWRVWWVSNCCRSLKLCEECGGVTKLPCLKCKGRGQVTEGFFSALSSEPRERIPCLACKGRGQFPCPSCSKQ